MNNNGSLPTVSGTNGWTTRWVGYGMGSSCRAIAQKAGIIIPFGTAGGHAKTDLLIVKTDNVDCFPDSTDKSRIAETMRRHAILDLAPTASR